MTYSPPPLHGISRSFGVVMWVMYRCLPPWVKKGDGYARNRELGIFNADSPAAYVRLCSRYVCLQIFGGKF